MPSRTYTLLVTINDDDLPGTAPLAARVHRALEEGLKDNGKHFPAIPGVICATVDAFIGDVVHGSMAGVHEIKQLHRSLHD